MGPMTIQNRQNAVITISVNTTSTGLETGFETAYTHHTFLINSCAFRVRSRKRSQNTRMNLDLECSIQK